MPNRRRSASRSASPSQSRSRTGLDSGQQRDGDNDEDKVFKIKEEMETIKIIMRIKVTVRMLEMTTLLMVQALNQLILSCCQ